MKTFGIWFISLLVWTVEIRVTHVYHIGLSQGWGLSKQNNTEVADLCTIATRVLDYVANPFVESILEFNFGM